MKINVIDRSNHWQIPVNGQGVVRLHIAVRKAIAHLSIYDQQQRVSDYLDAVDCKS
jgi:hypothetical protein